ncbi:ATP-grasp domain-containing protein [Nocardia sp. NPDC058114]|uniref:ATP-grasp domain-containing protein n=1 Tax=Nocardia sp. NPDC058114 TaxID=3346346 RepID=UPI0036DD4C5A
MIKDYVKSRKYEWNTACFVPDLSDGAVLRRVVERFVELQGDSLAGGIVVREFEAFARRVDGTWRVIEVGDGQVSDLPAGVDPMELIGPLILAK